MKIGIIISTNEPETIYNAFRFANFSIKKEEKNEIKIFLIGQGVEIEDNNYFTIEIKGKKFDIMAEVKEFISLKGELFSCGTCVKIRQEYLRGYKMEICPISTMQDMYDIVKWSEKLITF